MASPGKRDRPLITIKKQKNEKEHSYPLPIYRIAGLCILQRDIREQDNYRRRYGTNGKPQPGTIHLTRAEFLKKVADYENHSKEWKYLGDKPAIVDFYADWCGPCKMVAPILEELSKEYAGKIYIYKVDVDKEPELAKAFGIQSIPTLWFVPMKGEPQVSMGALSKEQLKGYIDKVLLKP